MSGALERLGAELRRVVVGQEQLLDGLLVGLLGGGHVLLEGAPGLAKTLAARTLAGCVGGSFSRIQMTPDLLPSDLVGYQAYIASEQRLEVRLGPVAANLVLADEVNRAPAKVQSALLEAMQEQQVTVAGQTFALPRPYMVIATQNPLEQQGTYPLPEAQKDRFLLQLTVDYPRRADERLMLERLDDPESVPQPRCVVSAEEVLELRRAATRVHVDGRVRDYALDLVVATRPGQESELSERQRGLSFRADEMLEHGASPRASLGLLRASRALALLRGRDFVLPEDVQAMAEPVLAHRLTLNVAAESRGVTAETVVRQVLEAVAVP